MMGKKGGRRERECFYLPGGVYVWRCVSAAFPLHLFSIVQENAIKAKVN